MSYQNLLSLTGKVALITGGTGGLGSEIALAFLENGADVIVSGRSFDQVEKPLTQAAQKAGVRCLMATGDIRTEAGTAQLLEQCGTIGAVDILVNAAGTNTLLPAEDYDDASFLAVLDLNLLSLHRITREIGKGMIAQKSGRIINLSSVKGQLSDTQNYAAYCASKGAVNMYTKAIACEWAKHGITCNAIAPTFVRTAISEKQLKDPVFYNKIVSSIPLGRLGSKRDVAAAALFLASDAASFITGQILGVDGGLTAVQKT